MFSFLKPPPPKEPLPKEQIDPHYRWLREQVFLGTFVGYAAYYLLRNNFSLAMPALIDAGFSEEQLGYPVAAIGIGYGLSKFFMGSVSDRSNARIFITLGLLLTAVLNIVFGLCPFATSTMQIMVVFMLINGWFQGMGWPACGRSMVHWFSVSERGTRMSIWNVAHNVGGGLVGPFAILGLYLFRDDWRSVFYFPALVAIVMAIIVYFLMRDTPQSCGLPSIEEYKNEYPPDYSQRHEKELTTWEILFKYVLTNKYLWSIAFANAFVYLVRYGVIDWAPVFLVKTKELTIDKAGWAYFFYEFAAIPGTLLCGWLSDRVFQGRRAPVCIIYMLLVAASIFAYWFCPAGNVFIAWAALIAIGFLIYGPVMLIGVHALDLVPKKAAGTAAGLTGMFGYFIGKTFAGIGLGKIITRNGWNTYFILILGACLLSVFFVALTWRSGSMQHKAASDLENA